MTFATGKLGQFKSGRTGSRAGIAIMLSVPTMPPLLMSLPRDTGPSRRWWARVLDHFGTVAAQHQHLHSRTAFLAGNCRPNRPPSKDRR
jgi:hypothetical protein